MAEARSASRTGTGFDVNPTMSETQHALKVGKTYFEELQDRASRTQRQIYSGLWPTTWDNIFKFFVIAVSTMHIDHPKVNVVGDYFWRFGDLLYLDSSWPYYFRLLTIALISAILYFICVLYTRQYLLRILLSYKGWLYMQPRQQSWIVLAWGLLVRITSGRKPTLYSYQNSLPRMSVPPLADTIRKFLESVKPVLETAEFEKMTSLAKEFRSTLAPKLQRILHLKSWWARNYHTDWWEKYVYLMGRDSISINSNYYVLDQCNWFPTRNQAARAAGVTSLMLAFKKLMDTEELVPLVIRKTIPVCMAQYVRMFGTSRIPQDDIDKLRHRPDAEHIVVMCKGHYYTMHVVDAHGLPLNTLDLEASFQWIIHDAANQKTPAGDPATSVCALTGLPRTEWAQARQKHFTNGINKDNLYALNSALFVVSLDDNAIEDVSKRAKHLLHGDTTNLWFDKSFTVVIFANGKMGVNVEHSWADAPVMGHCIEYVISNEYLFRMYDDHGNCKPFINTVWTTVNPNDHKLPVKRSKAMITPMKMYWDIEEELASTIAHAVAFCRKNNDDLDLVVAEHKHFGKDFIKTAKVSPDAYVQMALQLAYNRDSVGKFALTYEASMTRLYLDGRTETVRSFTQEVKSFVEAMNDENASAKERWALMKQAAEKHQSVYRDCMSNKGIDRHMFSLYVACRGQGYDSVFLKSALTMPWTLATSQVPQTQMDYGMDMNIPEIRNTISQGGGFGPVTDKGYGISYMLPDGESLYFHVSSKHSASNTDSQRYMDNIFWAMQAMKDMVEEAQKK